MRTLAFSLSLLLAAGCVVRVNEAPAPAPPKPVSTQPKKDADANSPGKSDHVVEDATPVPAPIQEAMEPPVAVTPAKAEPTHEPAIAPPPFAGRKFVDAIGSHSTEAEFVKAEHNRVHLRKRDGVIVELMLSQLSESDKSWIVAEVGRRRREQAKLSEAKAKLAAIELKKMEARIAAEREKLAANRKPVTQKSSDDSDRVWVNGYTRKDGTNVKGYWRKK